jgi:uncharacterized protein (TIGR01777 family)
MRVVIAGGSGFLGRALSARLVAGGHDVTILTRSATDRPGGPRVVLWTPNGHADVWLHALDGADAIVNLTGAGIADRRWTPARKAELRSSRLLPTQSLVHAIESVGRRPNVFIQGSGIGYYGASLDDREIDESRPAGGDFLGRLCVEWESAAAPIAALGCRVVYVRTGLVMGRHGGALPKMALPFRLFAGGPTGTGRQYMPWIHLDDWIALVAWAIGSPTVAGPLNACAPAPVTNETFARTLGHALGRPSWLRAPAVALHLILGTEFADLLLLNGQRAIPRRARDLQFSFSHSELDEALADLFPV